MIFDAPQPEPGRWQAIAFTILVHIGLLVFLVVGVQWKHKAPTVVSVEIWSGRPHAPTHVPTPVKAVTPPPEIIKPVEPVQPPAQPVQPPKQQEALPKPVKPPDIAVKADKDKPKPVKPEKEKPVKPEKEKPLKPEKDKPTQPVRREDTLPQPRSKAIWQSVLRSEEVARGIEHDQAQLAAAAAEATGRRVQASWMDRIRGKIRGNTVQPPNLRGNPVAVFNVSLLPSGEIFSVNLKRSSGIRAWDDATERAIRKSSPLPKPEDLSAFERELELKLCPDEEQGCR